MIGPLTVLVTLGSGVALAQSNSDPDCGIANVYPSARQDLMRRAATDNTSLYGAVGTAERKVLPAMKANEGMKMLVFEQHVLAGALAVPAMAGGPCEDEVLLAPVDLTSGNWALAWSKDDFGLFYNASITTASAYGAGAMRGFGGFISTAGVIYYGLAAPFFPSGGKVMDDGSVTWDWIAGAEYTPGTLAFAAGYVGSKGVYFNASEATTGAFFGAAANDSFAEVPYLRGGIEHLLVPKVSEKIGRSSLFGRKLVLPGAVNPAEDEDTDFYTAHAAQEGMAGIVDLWATYALKPTPFFHELRIGGHTRNFLGIDPDEEGWGVRGTAGLVTMPEKLDLDVEGGRRFAATVETTYRVPGGGSFGLIEMSMKYNDPGVLALFPYAEDALDIYFSLQFGEN
jgi:hypothetical protein